MVDILGYVAAPAISIICFFVGQLFKNFTADEYHKHVPSLVATTGLVISVLGYIFIENYIPAQNIIEAIAIGIVSGIGATGVHQIIKQYKKEE